MPYPLIPRKTAQLFGASLTPSGNVAVFGSLLAGSPAFSNDLAAIQALAAWGNGMNGAVVGNNSPALEDLNGLFLTFAQQIAYILQAGVPEYDAGTTYFLNGQCRIGLVTFVSRSNNNLGNDPLTDSNNWQPLANLAKGPTLAAAWVEFDGINVDGSGNSILHSQFNVDHVVKNANGSYTIVFASALPSSHYAITGSCGSEDGQPYGVGDDGLVVGNVTGQGNAIRSAAQCRVFTINPTNKALVASGDVSVLFFGR